MFVSLCNCGSLLVRLKRRQVEAEGSEYKRGARYLQERRCGWLAKWSTLWSTITKERRLSNRWFRKAAKWIPSWIRQPHLHDVYFFKKNWFVGICLNRLKWTTFILWLKPKWFKIYYQIYCQILGTISFPIRVQNGYC